MAKKAITKKEENLLKIIKMNQDLSLPDDSCEENTEIDKNIAESEKILKNLNYGFKLKSLKLETKKVAESDIIKVSQVKSFDTLKTEANEKFSNTILTVDDILSKDEINEAYNSLRKVEKEFSKQTSIINKTDLIFLGIATALQVGKSLLFPTLAKKFEYGEPFDKKSRLPHDDKSITNAHNKANKEFIEKHKKSGSGNWIKLVTQTPPYDTTKGSPNIGFKMEGGYHRFHTLGHDPVMGWIFGTANILTDVITLNTMQSYKVARNPLIITPKRITTSAMFNNCKKMIDEDFMNLPAAVFAQYRHLKSDEYTKAGLPVPFLEMINADFPGELYKKQYDALCLSRDLKIIGASASVSMIIDMIIGLVHALFYNKNEQPNRELYEVRTRKILLISNTIATSSSIICSSITSNPKNLDIGSLIVTISHLFLDVRFIAKVKQEFIESKYAKELSEEIEYLNSFF